MQVSGPLASKEIPRVRNKRKRLLLYPQVSTRPDGEAVGLWHVRSNELASRNFNQKYYVAYFLHHSLATFSYSARLVL